jgi:hypothetical protein
MGRLNDLAHKYEADKANNVRDSHAYADVYEKLLEKFDPARVRLLEIGLWDPQKPGASPRMWHEFLPEAKLFGIDINPDAAALEKEIGMRVIWADQGFIPSLEMASSLIGKVDFLIDDGSHQNQHIINTLRVFWKNVVPGGVYCIEDLHAPYAAPIEKIVETAQSLENLESAEFASAKLLVLRKAE